MRFALSNLVVWAACLVMQQWSGVAVGQESKLGADAGAIVGTTAAKNLGAADGAMSLGLTGERRPLYCVRKSDVLEVSFTFTPEFNQTVRVQPDGFVVLKTAGLLYVEGQTLPELTKSIRAAYAATLHDPEVTVVLQEFDKPYFIATGAVGRPGKYELRADTTVVDAIAIAGGFSSEAKHSQVVLYRRVADGLKEGRLLDIKKLLQAKNLGEDLHLHPGDLVFVPQNTISKVRKYLPLPTAGMYVNPAQF